MSLLDDVSIVVTPNGYKAGTLYSVLPTAAEGSELVTCGDFACADPNAAWSPVGLATISGGVASFVNNGTNANSYIGQNIIQSNKFYKITFDVTRYVVGGVQIVLAGTTHTIDISAGVNTYIVYLLSGSSDTIFRFKRNGGLGNFNFDVDNVSVKQDTGADMDVTRATAATRVDENGLVNYAEVIGSDLASGYDFTSGWGIFGGGTSITNSTSFESQSGQGIYTGLGLVVNKLYKIKITGTQPSGGYFSLQSGTTGTNLKNISGTSFNEVIYATPTVVTGVGNDFYIRLSSHSVGSLITISNLEIEEVTRDNVPRIDYTGGGCPHILAEPQRTNLITYSEDFSNSYWTKSGASVTSGIVSPDGTANAYKLVEDSANSRHFINSTEFTTSGTVYSSSVFVKASGRSKIALRENAQTGKYASFNLSNGTLIQTNGVSASIELISNGWYRINYQITSGATIILGIELLSDSYTSGDPYANPYQGNGSSGVEIYGGQVEEGSYATSYIPTSGSAVTRNQDVFTRDGIASLINSPEGVLFVEMAALTNDTSFRAMSISDGSTSNRITLVYNGGIRAFNVVGNSVSSNIDYSTTITTTQKIAIVWSSSSFALWVNGSEINSQSGISIPSSTLNKLSLDQGNGGNNMFSKIKQLQVYKTALTDNQLIQLTGESGTHFFESYAEMAEALTYTIQ